jgi:hypothetical protein
MEMTNFLSKIQVINSNRCWFESQHHPMKEKWTSELKNESQKIVNKWQTKIFFKEFHLFFVLKMFY